MSVSSLFVDNPSSCLAFRTTIRGHIPHRVASFAHLHAFLGTLLGTPKASRLGFTGLGRWIAKIQTQIFLAAGAASALLDVCQNTLSAECMATVQPNDFPLGGTSVCFTHVAQRNPFVFDVFLYR